MIATTGSDGCLRRSRRVASIPSITGNWISGTGGKGAGQLTVDVSLDGLINGQPATVG